MAELSWYWHRLRAMGPAEVGAHLKRKLYQFRDGRPRRWGVESLRKRDLFPRLPARERAPISLRLALARESEAIQRGDWKAFGHLGLCVDDPPVWHKDYLAGRDLTTRASAFGLDHRSLPGGADVKLVWELSRWHALVRLAQAGWLLGEAAAGWKCVRLLEDWEGHNPPFRGWNWTSALESGMRLIQSVWIDALLGGEGGEYGVDLERVWRRLLPAHVWFTWRYKTVGSSANNHLIGELAGLIAACVRWPDLERWGAGLDELQMLWEAEVLAQFAEDGGNREQALNYQLFSWELCWQARTALMAAGRSVGAAVEDRLRAAMQFFVVVQVEQDGWDYGDSDDAFAVPLFQDHPVAEWLRWAIEPEASPSIGYWLGEGSGLAIEAPGDGTVRYGESGQVVIRAGVWFLRWDLSELGYQSTAAHGHLDALHLSIWVGGVAMVIDPGTGAYYGDKPLRNWLASREAHNGPCPRGVNYPRRLGPFLWQSRHAKPVLTEESDRSMTGEMALPGNLLLRRRIIRLEGRLGWRVEDGCDQAGRGAEFEVRWQLAPGAVVEALGERRFRVTRREQSIWIDIGPEWTGVELEEAKAGAGGGFDGIVSPGFRATCAAPFLRLTASGREKPCVFGTTFLASAPS